MTNYSDWIGREQTQSDQVTQASLDRFCATFGLPLAQQVAPAGFHWCLCLPSTETSRLGEDGHPAKGGFIPPIALPRRMWAASQVEFINTINVGDRITRHSKIAEVNAKTGKTGKLVFVEVAHETLANDQLAINERQTIVYREAAQSMLELPADDASHPDGWDIVEEVVPTPPLLFRYSSLTFNTHRIHYDRAYAKSQELYPELVVHAPFMATKALLLAQRERQLSSFSFKAVSAAFCNQSLYLVANLSKSDGEICTLGGDARVCLKSKVVFNGA